MVSAAAQVRVGAGARTACARPARLFLSRAPTTWELHVNALGGHVLSRAGAHRRGWRAHQHTRLGAPPSPIPAAAAQGRGPGAVEWGLDRLGFFFLASNFLS